MASLEHWEQRGKGPSGPTVVSLAFSAGVIALGVLLVKNGVLVPPTLTELNDPVVKRGWAPLYDVGVVGSTTPETAPKAPAEADKPPAPAATAQEPEAQRAGSTPVAPPAATSPAQGRTTTAAATRASSSEPKEQSDPYAHLEEAAGTAPAPAAPTVPQVQSAPRVLSEKNTSVTEAPSPAPTSGSAAGGGKSTWGGERSTVEGR